MFTVYCNTCLIHAPTFGNNDMLLPSAKLTMEVNSASSFDFTILPSHKYYDEIILNALVKIYDGSERIFFGRISDVRKDLYRRKVVHVDGDLSFLDDIAVRNYTQTSGISLYLTALCAQYNNYADTSRLFEAPLFYGSAAAQAITITRSSVSYQSILDEIREKVISALGGYMWTDCVVSNGVEKSRLCYVLDESPQGNQTITFGRNMIDLTDYVDKANTFSAIIPLGAETNSVTHERLNIKSVNNNAIQLENATLSALYGYVEKRVIYDDITDATALKAKGQADLDNVAARTRTITISAVDLHLLDVNVDALKLGYAYQVIAPKNGLNGEFFVLSKIKIDLNKPEAGNYIFGLVRKTLTGGLTNWQT